MSQSNQFGPFATRPATLDTRDRRLEPCGWYRDMRETAPVRYDEDRETWDVFRYDDVTQVLSDHETFSSDMDLNLGGGLLGEDTPIEHTMIFADPPEHDRLRGVVDEQFRPGTLREFRPEIEHLTTDLLADATGTSRIDIVDDVAYPLPVIVIANLLGVPPEQRDQFKAWSDTMIAAPDELSQGAFDDVQQQRMQSLFEMVTYFQELIAERRADPQDDLITQLAQSETLSDQEVLGFCMLLLIAGNITTTNLITNAIWCFTEEGYTDAVRTGEVDRQQAIEEVLRYRSPVQAMSRVVTADTTLAGKQLDAGDTVTAWIGSANRDDRVFDEPDVFKPERTPNRHIAFGKGIHYCLGAPLARMEADIAIEQLLTEFPSLERIDEPLEPVQSSIVYGLEHLPVSVTQ